MRSLVVAIKMTVVLTLLTGIVYPIAMAGLGRVLFPAQADGSLIYKNGSPVGSSLIAQNFKAARYFHPRPSAAGTNGYDPTSSGGSNLGPTNKSFIDSVKQRTKDVMEADSVPASQVPIDMVTASGSGLDPQISPAAAEIQVERVAKARGLSADTVRALDQRQHAAAMGWVSRRTRRERPGTEPGARWHWQWSADSDEVVRPPARRCWQTTLKVIASAGFSVMRTETAVSKKSDRAAAIIDSLDEPAFVLDEADTIIHLNRGAAEILDHRSGSNHRSSIQRRH